MIRILFFFLLLSAISCSTREKGSPQVYFAGEIVNPTSNFVVLYKDDIEIDSAKLDANNRFVFLLDTIDEGLYNFKHSPELQYIFLEKGDSLVIRLNTTDFDESLVFAGEGEGVNNFLLEMFLTSEEEESVIYAFYEDDPEEFSRKIDSLRENKMSLLLEVDSQYGLSDNAREIAQASIDYNYFIYKELYPFYHKKRKGMEEVPDLPSGFYAYRGQLDMNNKHLTYFRPYYKFINYHLGNLTYMQCMKDCDSHDQRLESYLHFNKHKLGLIDSLITEKALRDNVFRHVAIDYLLKVQDKEANNIEFIETFHKLSGNNRHIKEIDNLYQGIMNIQPNRPLPDIELTTVDGRNVGLKEIAKGRNVVFYFWSGTQKGHFDNIANRVAELSDEKKEYSFVGINFNTDEARWKALIESKGLDKDLQFRSDDYEHLTSTLILYPMNKAIITKDTLIVNAFANLYASF